LAKNGKVDSGKVGMVEKMNKELQVQECDASKA
jgi:hypothetical protein